MAKKKSDEEELSTGKKIFLGLLAFVVVVMLFSALSPDETANNSANAGNETSAENSEKTYRFSDRADKQAKDVELAINEAGTVGGVKLTVASAEYKTSINAYTNADDGKTYIVANVALENTSDRTKPYNVYDFRVQTAGGQVLDATFLGDNTLSSGDLVTGGKVSGTVSFEVPIEEGHQYLIWKPGLSSDRAIVQIK